MEALPRLDNLTAATELPCLYIPEGYTAQIVPDAPGTEYERNVTGNR